ncbi:MAG: UDP-3-O-acyl-N-acetylglucosamine deacetylase [Armatimonadetes bacterium]|nr:UDP-3-O-acyl-N-acetylglucosamine deacetylase [Armatimonadota bacterium]MCX7968834.1 UDP-3-O-acyl-N-acetylglucosamine deacetylase [Armatimonadota bacterium]MDW8143825.1 UDP-3-O-acyl-N-acetylglucosamine deacetylase [Armatimonadota bacterium]
MTRKTLNGNAKVEGIGLHTGEKSVVWLHPADAGTGILFRVSNAQGEAEIPALVPFVAETRRRVVLRKGGVAVQTVEHLLATCFGMGVTDLIVEVQGIELPVGDGSAQIWVETFKDAGITDLGKPAHVFVPQKVTVEQGEAVVAVEPNEAFSAQYVFVTEHPLVGVQVASFDFKANDFEKDIAPARTFGFWEEVQPLWEQGLAKGGSLENAVVIFPDHYSVPLRFPNELARHKLLDLMGDLMLLGVRLQGKVHARSSGHTHHFQLCQILWQRVEQEARA